MLAIVECIKKWKPQLTGIRFEILTDHAPLIYWKTQKDLSPRQIRWNERLSRFDTDIHHIPGISNSAADALSRYPYVQNENVFTTTTVQFNDQVLESVKSHYDEDKFFGAIIREPEQFPLYTIDDGLIFFEGRLCIPSNDRTSRNSLLALCHDSQNHFGIDKTRRTIMRDYFWPGIVNDVVQYIKSCTSCAQNKSNTQAPAGFLHSMPIPMQRFTEIAMDFVGPLPKSKGYDMLFVMTDRLTGYVKIEPYYTTATAKDIADLLYRSWYRQFGFTCCNYLRPR